MHARSTPERRPMDVFDDRRPSKMSNDTTGLSYRDAGVDVEAADAFVDRIAAHTKSTHGAVDVLKKTAYAGLVRAPIADMSSPLIAATCDGVGTKLLVARQVGWFEGLGQDLVAMNVNDLLPAAARPLLFLDYLAVGKLDPAVMEQIVAGIASACRESSCALIGGETAEMPGVYAPDDFDLAGFAVGIVDEDRVPDPKALKPDDVILGLPSAGVHSNGLSLARKALFERGGYTVDSNLEVFDVSLGREVLTPTRLYVRDVMDFLVHSKFTAAAHITGGGLLGRLEKLAVDGIRLHVDPTTYSRPEIFNVIQKAGDVSDEDMARTFNLGLGFCIVVDAETAAEQLARPNNNWLKVGHVAAGEKGVELGFARS